MTTEHLQTVDESTLAHLIQGVHDAVATRYTSGIGLVVLLYDHALTFSDEVEFIWSARPSFAKKLFLLNRYIVVVSQICIACFMNHFSGDDIPNSSCQTMITLAFAVGICSVACGNVLVILRVVTLWDRNKYIARVMAFGFCASFLSTIVFAILVLRSAISGFAYESLVHTCISIIKAPTLPGVWASSLVFEVLVLSFVLYNALNRPRSRNTPLRRVLYRDGILFFACLATLRSTNLIISIIARPSLIMCGVFFVWAMTTLVLNRSMLNIHKATSESLHMRLPSRNNYDVELPNPDRASSCSWHD